MQEELREEQRRLRATFFRLEREMREVKQQLAVVNRKLAGTEAVGAVQMSLGMDEPKTRTPNIPPDEVGDEFAALAREPLPDDVEVIYTPSSGMVPADFTFKGTGRVFHDTVVTCLAQRANATSALLLDALRLQFPDRTVPQLRSQLNITLKRMIDQRRIRKVSRGIYALISSEKTVGLTRSGHLA
jgi:hypothetical protein